MPETPVPVAVLYRGHALAEALISGLRRRGWLPHFADPELPDSTMTAGARPSVVIVEDDEGRLPATAVSVATRMAGHGRRAVVAVAGMAALQTTVQVVAAGATAVNADQPYRRLLTSVHEALAAGPVALADHERLLADLRERANEASRFRALTARECAVLTDLAIGLNAETIAASRVVGLATIRTQIAAVLRKLEVRSQLAAIALTHRSCADARVAEPLAQFHQHYG
jgi:DNA-binding NarL/FixJ family response regulator